MKKFVFLSFLMLTAFLFSCKTTGPCYLPPPYDYQPIELANDCIKVDSLVAYYDASSQIVAEFVITDSSGKSYYFGGDYDQNQHIWCYMADSVNGRTTQLDRNDYDVSELLDGVHSSNAIGLILDNSKSIGDFRAILLQNALYNLISKKSDNDGFFMINIDGKPKIIADLSKDKDQLTKSLKKNKLTGSGTGTALSKAMHLGLDVLDTVKNYDNKVLFVFTDGYNNRNPSTKSVIDKARKNNVRIILIGYGENISHGYMHDVASQTNGAYYIIKYSQKYPNAIYDIYSKLNFRPVKYRITYKPQNFDVAHYLIFKICLPQCTTAYRVKAVIRQMDILQLNIKFKFKSFEIQGDTSLEQIDKVATYLKSNPDINIRLEGNTDCIGSRESNLALSQKRAGAVKDALIDKGIPKSRIDLVGYGFDRPYVVDINDNKRYWFLPVGKPLTCEYINALETDYQKQIAHSLNRRTQLVVTKN